MVETPKLRLRERETGVSLESTLKKEIRLYSRKEEYDLVPWYMKRIAKKAAFQALLVPRVELFETIKLMRDVESTLDRDSAMHSIWGEGDDVLPREEALRFMRSKHFNEYQRTKYLTKLDRELLSSLLVSIGFAEEESEGSRFDKSDIIAAQNLSRDLVRSFHKYLPKAEQWDKNSRAEDIEENVLFTAKLVPEYNDFEILIHKRKKKKKGKHK